jgi:uncharacterized membrane protein YozB (DUF420 family)
MNLRLPPGLFNPNATPLADLTLVAYVLILFPAMLIGFYFARRKKFSPQHKGTMTFITAMNWLLILFVMAVSYGASVRPALPDGLAQPMYLLPTIHLAIGALAQLLATYLLFRMWFEDVLPGWTKVRRIKRWMRLTLLLWFLTVVLGVVLYVLWYTPVATVAAPVLTPAATPEVGAPVATQELTLPVVTPELNAPVATPELIPPAATAEPSG